MDDVLTQNSTNVGLAGISDLLVKGDSGDRVELINGDIGAWNNTATLVHEGVTYHQYTHSSHVESVLIEQEINTMIL